MVHPTADKLQQYLDIWSTQQLTNYNNKFRYMVHPTACKLQQYLDIWSTQQLTNYNNIKIYGPLNSWQTTTLLRHMVHPTADKLQQYLYILFTQQLTNYNNILLDIEPEFIKNKNHLNSFSHACIGSSLRGMVQLQSTRFNYFSLFVKYGPRDWNFCLRHSFKK